jgi:hypothetical protein
VNVADVAGEERCDMFGVGGRVTIELRVGSSGNVYEFTNGVVLCTSKRSAGQTDG